ncbi:MAG: rubrerythrin family protein [Alphaproteobacteria bacterium]|nr:rubrerythrin family protein [Alphaproteobacteria bacterium]
MKKNTKDLMIKFQKAEINAAFIYAYFAKKLKDKHNKDIISKIAMEEAEHAKFWQKHTGKSFKPNRFKLFWYIFLMHFFGFTFVIKLLEIGEYSGAKELEALIKEIPFTAEIIKQEEEHEKKLITLLNEERLNYVGAMVLGLNDALVELTGTIAGLTFVLMNTTLIAMAGVITGISATLSMAASNYLAERADGNPKALKASVYTGVAYLITVFLLVLPYFIFPSHMFLYALLVMLLVVVLEIAFFNYYISVVRSERFLPKFIEMSGISLSVALIAFLIGLLAKQVLGLDV